MHLCLKHHRSHAGFLSLYLIRDILSVCPITDNVNFDPCKATISFCVNIETITICDSSTRFYILALVCIDDLCPNQLFLCWLPKDDFPMPSFLLTFMSWHPTLRRASGDPSLVASCAKQKLPWQKSLVLPTAPTGQGSIRVPDSWHGAQNPNTQGPSWKVSHSTSLEGHFPFWHQSTNK
jgi:hypothetical protein